MIKTVTQKYFPEKVAKEIIRSKNDEIDWLRKEIKHLRYEVTFLLKIIARDKAAVRY